MKDFWKRLFAKHPAAPAAATVARSATSNTDTLRAAPRQATTGADQAGKLADEVAKALIDAAIVDGSLIDATYVFLPSDEAPEETRQRTIKGMESAGRGDIADSIRKYGYRRMRFALTARDTFSGVPLDAMSPIQAGQAVEVIERALSVPLRAWRSSSTGNRSKFFRHAVEEAARWCLAARREADAASLYALIVELQLEATNLPDGALYGPGRADDARPAAVPAVAARAMEEPTLGADAPPPLGEALYRAIIANDVSDLRALLQRPGDHHLAVDSDGWTALHHAARVGNIEAIELLLARGSSPIAQDGKNKWTPLHYAAFYGHGHLVHRLVGAGGDPNALSGPAANAPLHVAAMSGAAGAVSALVESGADACLANRDGHVPLICAAKHEHVEAAEALLDAGADINAAGPQDASALHWAVSKESHALVGMLLRRGAAADPVDHLGWTPVFLAARKSNRAIAKMLLAAGAKRQRTIDGREMTLGPDW